MQCIHGEIILRELDDLQGLSIGGRNLNNLRYADDTTLIAESQEKLQELLDKVVEESRQMGLSLNCKKTECMVISKKKIIPRCQLKINDSPIVQIKKFSYLGSMITEDGRCETEIKRRIGMAKDAFQKMKSILRNTHISMTTKRRILECYIFPILSYASECWTISKCMEKRLEAAEVWFYRRMLRISWIDRVSNAEVFRRAGVQRTLFQSIRKHQMEFYGHIMRKQELEALSATGKIEGTRSRGRQRQTYLKSLSEWANVSSITILHETRDRKRWKSMIANALRGHGT